MEDETDWREIYQYWYSSKEEKEKVRNLLLNLSPKDKEKLFQKNLFAEKIYVQRMRCFDNEDHLLLFLYLEETGEEKYPKVTTIARTKLTPDIDLLCIKKRYEPYHEKIIIIGYEAKVLGKKRIFNQFYMGLGEVLCYFRYGINQAWLVIGIPRNVPKDAKNKIEETWNFLKETHNIPSYVGLKILVEGKDLEIVDSPKGEFYASSHKYSKYMRESIINKQFVWNKQLLKYLS